jgi:hypothetical protein
MLWNPVDQQNPDRKQIAIVNIGIGQERLTEHANENYIDKVFLPGLDPILIVEGNDSAYIGVAQLGLLPTPSMLALKQLPGNDPTNISSIGNVVRDDQGRIANGIDLNLWQWNYYGPLPKGIESLIWLFYF